MCALSKVQCDQISMAKVYFNLVKLIATDSLFPGTTVCGNERDINRHVETQAREMDIHPNLD